MCSHDGVWNEVMLIGLGARSGGLCRAVDGMSALRWGVGREVPLWKSQRVRCEICA